jgi:branched-chain amino acid transport system ATP-binding protein
LDETSLGLAPLVVKTIYKIIKEINSTKTITILLVEQNVRHALETADRAFIIENGRIVGQGAAQDLLNSDQVKSAYLAIG